MRQLRCMTHGYDARRKKLQERLCEKRQAKLSGLPETNVDRAAWLFSRSHMATAWPAGLLTMDGDAASSADQMRRHPSPAFPVDCMGIAECLRFIPRGEVDRAVSFAARHTVLQLRVQCTILTYFPIIRMHRSGTGMQKEQIHCNDFFDEGQRFSPPVPGGNNRVNYAIP